ncbi:uncharacterized protein LOC110870332 [Helianthus annuus]|uniref:uncharacterized protein LOC110870332 n=1 Tax=Helianthus annuus TaxID=4232 RepID=UPI000B8F5D8C|nr:uncharacterized protein LOC110870332 [Helianthus annuus]
MALSVKLRWLKNNIKAWLKVGKNRVNGEYLVKKNRIHQLERLAESGLLEDGELDERAECISFIMDSDRRNQMDAKQKSRSRWAIEGDENTAFYHNAIKANISNNRINGIIVNGEWSSDPVVVKEKFFEFFANQFMEPMASRPSIMCQNMVSLSATEANSLIEPFSLSEIKDAIWGCVGDRAPGPDGFNFKFIKNNWDLFQGDFLKVFQEFHSKGSISRCCSSSFIALIPKTNDPISPSNFRPISLIGVVNKAISKVLVNRLKKVVGKLVSEEQTAFLSGRNISDGPLILNEVIAWMKKAKKSGMVFKIDINKAYDSLNWKFLESVMTQMNFPVTWREWIMATLVSSRASVLVNGSPTMEFECTRGLQQGDPLSPFLFVIAMEALSGVNEVEVQLMANVLGCKKGSFPFKHLGLVVGANMNLIRNWKPVIDIFKNRLSLLKAKNLSYGAPAKVLDILERLRRVFFWGGSDENSHMSWMAWEKVTAPLEYGGLGFGSLRDANLAMLSKWWWGFKLDKDHLWRKVIWAIHHNNRSWAPILAKMSIPGPWKQIIRINTHLNQIGINFVDAIRCQVGCGSKAAFWLDIWISEQPLCVKFPLLFALEIDKSCSVSDRVSWGENTMNLSWRWKRPVTSASEQEELVWKYDKSEYFTVASIKNISATVSRSVLEYLFFWNKLVPKKVGVVSWRALSERLPTQVALAARNVYIADNRCLFYRDYEETCEHLFVSCQFTQSVWLIIFQWCKTPPTFAFSLKDIRDAHVFLNGSKMKRMVLNAIAQVVIWCIWRLRNEIVFGQATPNITKVVEESKSMAYH